MTSKIRFCRAALLGLGIAFLSACGTFQSKDKPVITEIPKAIPEEGYTPSTQYGRVALDDNQRVDQWIKYFTGRGRKYMHIYLERSARYIPMMKATFRERGMPDELAYIAMIESGFSPTAFSNASAVGYWQFIRDTGKRYNLRIDPYVDERRDPILSTQAAATYLDSLFAIFGDWHLSLAAYNAGERRILNAVMKRRTRNFWELISHRRTLAKETMNYIPKFIAAVKIASDPGAYGFTDIDFQQAFAFDSVVIERPISLETLAKEMNVPYEDLKKMNPRYKSDFVPVYSDRINAVRVPVGMKEVAVAAVLKSASDAPMHYVASFEWYRVRRGDTLSHIARRFRTSIARIRDLNDFSHRSFIRVGQKIKVPEGTGYSEVRTKPDTSLKKTNSESKNLRAIAGDANQNSNSSRSSSYKVKKGDTLLGIANRNGLTISELMSLNNISGKYILKTGSKLKVREVAVQAPVNMRSSDENAQTTSGKKNSRLKEAQDNKVHVVRSGENLTTIAKIYNTTVGEIARVNRLSKRSKLFVGAQLQIP